MTRKVERRSKIIFAKDAGRRTTSERMHSTKRNDWSFEHGKTEPVNFSGTDYRNLVINNFEILSRVIHFLIRVRISFPRIQIADNRLFDCTLVWPFSKQIPESQHMDV